jgi:hypothetical protein
MNQLYMRSSGMVSGTAIPDMYVSMENQIQCWPVSLKSGIHCGRLYCIEGPPLSSLRKHFV